MSSTTGNDLSREKVKALLAAVGSKPTGDTAQIEATEYNWRQPHCFNSDQLRKLDSFTKETAAVIAQKFADFYHNDFGVTIASATQHFADELLKQTSDSEQRDYHLSFSTGQDQPCGVVSIPPQPAAIWTKQLLGDESGESQGKDLSQLEESLLLDIASAIIEALSESQDSYDFQPTDNIARGLLPLELQGTEELYKITFNIKEADSENNSEAHLVILCSKLESVAGRTAQAAGISSAEGTSKAILDHLREMLVSVTAQLASVVLTFEEMMSLQPGDILLLDKKVDEMAELIVEDRALFYGRPAKSAGRYAMVIAKLSCDTP
jgi:flagellar motor switch protein FliM